MGWDVVKVGKNITTRKFIEWDIKRTYDGIYDVVKIEEGKNYRGEKAFYVAFKKVENQEIFACVYLTARKNGWVSTKVISENSGPNYYEASQKFIDVLTPASTYEGAWWRNRCIEKESVNV